MMKQIKQTYPKMPSPCNCLNIRRAAQAVTQFYDDALKDSGLTVTQLGLLSQVERAGVVSIGDLSKMMRSDRTTINRNMKPLIAAGFVEIVQGRDLRVRQLSLTAAGSECVAAAYALWQSAQESLTAYLGAEELKQLTGILSKVEAITP